MPEVLIKKTKETSENLQLSISNEFEKELWRLKKSKNNLFFYTHFKIIAVNCSRALRRARVIVEVN